MISEAAIESSPILLLLRAVLCAGPDVCSYPEFVKRLGTSHKAHPIVRIAAWLKMVYSTVPEFKKSNIKPPLDRLERLQLVDQVGFPYIIFITPSANAIHTCEAFSKTGDYTDLKWMAHTLEHGYAIDWESVVKVWSTQFITEAEELEHLISVCPVSQVNTQLVTFPRIPAAVSRLFTPKIYFCSLRAPVWASRKE
jgi:hypothetical protein